MYSTFSTDRVDRKTLGAHELHGRVCVSDSLYSFMHGLSFAREWIYRIELTHLVIETAKKQSDVIQSARFAYLAKRPIVPSFLQLVVLQNLSNKCGICQDHSLHAESLSVEGVSAL